jgi:hypothetical protein
MKMIFVVVAFAALLAPTVFARPLTSAVYRTHKKHFRNHRDLYLPAQRSYQPPPGPDPTDQSLCKTAPGFCADYHGQNG